MYASSHSYTHLILALGIVRKPKVWVFITSKYPGIHDIGLPYDSNAHAIIAACKPKLTPRGPTLTYNALQTPSRLTRTSSPCEPPSFVSSTRLSVSTAIV